MRIDTNYRHYICIPPTVSSERASQIISRPDQITMFVAGFCDTLRKSRSRDGRVNARQVHVVILRRHAGPRRVEEVGRFLHRRRQASAPLAHMPAINRPTNHTTTHLQPSREETHTPAFSRRRRRRRRRHQHHHDSHRRHVCLCTRTDARVRVARLRVVVKVSHLLVACGPLHSPVHASRLFSF